MKDTNKTQALSVARLSLHWHCTFVLAVDEHTGEDGPVEAPAIVESAGVVRVIVTDPVKLLIAPKYR